MAISEVRDWMRNSAILSPFPADVLRVKLGPNAKSNRGWPSVERLSPLPLVPL